MKYDQKSFWRLVMVFLTLTWVGQDGFAQTETSIKGKLLLDSIWEPVVYLSHIPSFNDMHTMSNDMIIGQAEMGPQGDFKIPSSYLFEDDNLFRLHISKKGAPAASLIIGGKEENHIFFIANNRSSIHIRNTDSTQLFSDYQITGYAPNQGLYRIEEMLDSIENTALIDTAISSHFINKSVHEKLRMVADTSSHPIVSLYALHHSKFESSYLANQDFYKSYLKKWEGNNSIYFQALRAKLPYEKQNKNFWYFLIGGAFFVLGFLLHYYFNSIRKRTKVQLKLLSVQERKIFQLMQSGKSNKEISDEYNIGLSTVKSHVSSIYSKLNIKSRKEAMDFR